MRELFGNKWRLKPSILTSFVLLTVPVFLTIITVTYISNDRIARQVVFSVGVVAIVVCLCGKLRVRLERRQVVA